MRHYTSWGRYPKIEKTAPRPIYWRSDGISLDAEGRSLLPFGRGRSYGDVCINDGGVLLDTAPLNRFISFDREKGTLACEAGVTLAEILDLIVPRGFFLPVTPGTKFITLGGAIANDVHGKNHHRAGTFGRHVTRFELLRSDGRRLLCSPTENADWFCATIGGLGLTGLILWAEFTLNPIRGPFIEMEALRFSNYREFIELSMDSDRAFEHTAAWMDCLSKGDCLGRGLLLRGNHADAPSDWNIHAKRTNPVDVPIDAPGFLLNALTVHAFNEIYYRMHRSRSSKQLVRYDSFFYPLDCIGEWNRIYGKRGFFQYQCVVPQDNDNQALRSILETVAQTNLGSFLTVVKIFGDVKSPGMMSFPKKGVTIAMDFANQGELTRNLFDQLDRIVIGQKGSVYPAKDARMPPSTFQAYFPQWKAFTGFMDPNFSSSFWRRVTAQGAVK